MTITNEDPSYISIQEWQKYLGLKLLGRPAGIVYPVWFMVNRRHFRLGNAMNVCRWTKEMEVFLLLHDIEYHLLDWHGDVIESNQDERRMELNGR